MGHWPDNETAATTVATEPSGLVSSGFAPIELLIAITLLGIVAAILVPQMLSTREESRQYALLQRLHVVRGQIERFRDTHDGRLPAEGRNSATDFLLDLASLAAPSSKTVTNVTVSGRSVSDAARFARPEIEIPPANPYSQQSDILVIPDRLSPHHYSGDGRHGWAYSSTTGEFRANLSPQTTDNSDRLINQL